MLNCCQFDIVESEQYSGNILTNLEIQDRIKDSRKFGINDVPISGKCCY